jgi:hypothetical protein
VPFTVVHQQEQHPPTIAGIAFQKLTEVAALSLRAIAL